MKLKDACFLEKKKSHDNPRQHIKKKRHHFTDEGQYSQSYGFSRSHVQIWELNRKEGWAPRIDAFKLWSWRRHLRVPWTARRSNQSILKQVMSAAAAASKSLQSCLTLCDPIDSSPPGSSVPGILQTRTLEWVAISLSSAWKWKVKGKSFSHVWLFMTPWTEAYQAPPSMGFSRQEYWSGVPLPSPQWNTTQS